MASISITETVLRDGNQSFMATRMPLKSFESIFVSYTHLDVYKRQLLTYHTEKLCN